jgi:hypothetical protein
VPFLPLYFTTVWWDGLPYYYANDTYYTWNDDQQQYQVVAPPAGMESGASAQAPPSDELFAYPNRGQSTQQQANDRHECQQWAVDQSGFDPANAATAEAGDKRDAYFRAEVACLVGRGYTVR